MLNGSNVYGNNNNNNNNQNNNGMNGNIYEQSDLDIKHNQAVLNSANSAANLASASIYLQHQTAHRHPII